MSDQLHVVELHNHRLKQVILSLVNEQKRNATRLIGIENLGAQLQEKNEQIQRLKCKVEQLQDTVARAENRIAQLTLQLNNGSQTPSRGSIVTPGVSKKVLEALTKENTKLKLTLNHLANNTQHGTDVAVENKELHDLVLAQRNDLGQKRNEIKELKAALEATGEHDVAALQDQVKRLSVHVSKLERQLSGKQAFCETLVTENERLKEVVQTMQNERVTEVSALKQQLWKISQTSPELKKILDQVACDEGDGSEVHAAIRERDEFKVQLDELTAAFRQQEDEHKGLTELCKNLEMQLNEQEHQLGAAKRNKAELERKIELFSSERRDFTQLQQQLEKTTKAYEVLQEEQVLRQDALKEYENDFRREREEKDNFRVENNQLQERNRKLQEQCTILTRNNELFKQLKLSSPPAAQNYPRPQYSNQSCARQMQQPWNSPDFIFKGRPATADIDERPDCAPPTEKQFRHISDVQCPVCQQLFKCELIETHMRDCLGD